MPWIVQQVDLKTEAPPEDALPELRNYIDGAVEVPLLDRENPLRDPNDLRELQGQLSCDADQVERALAAAHAADQHREWENTAPAERAAALDAIADQLEPLAIREELARVDALTTGAVINVTRRMADLAPLTFRAAAKWLRENRDCHHLPGRQGDVEYFRRPWGAALLISPWNGPTAIGYHKIASALAAGAPCIAKPSEWAPHSTVMLADIIHRLGLPRGTFQLTCGSRQIGGAMVADPRISAISFTGGTAGGRAIARAAAEQFKPLQLELGGNNPLVVFPDADLERAATGIVFGLSNLNGQWCRALGRVVVHQSVKEALLERVSANLRELRLGHSLDPDSDMGPLIHRQQFESVSGALDRLGELGGQVICSTPLPDLPGYFIPPTLVDGCSPQDTEEEIFGPVATVHSFDTEQQALALANGTPYGLAAYVYSGDEARGLAFARAIRSGGVKLNGYSLLSLNGSAPRGAWGLSGLGEEGTSQTIEFFTGARVVGISAQDPLGGR